MPQIIFSLAEPPVLVLAVLCTAITIYLLTARDRTRDSRFLLSTFVCWTLYFLLSVCREALYPPIWWAPIAETGIGRLGLALFVGFAYRFRGNPYPRESRIGIAIALTSVVCSSSLIILETLTGNALSWSVGSGTSLLLFIWAEVVFVRRWLQASNPREARGHRSFALVFLLSAAAVGVKFLRDLGDFPAGPVPLICSLLYLCNLVGFILVYVNNALRPTTFQVKIVGVSLFTILAVLTVVWTALSPAAPGTPLTAGTALRLTPQGSGSYRVDSIPAHFDAVLGKRIKTRSGVEVDVGLDSPFPFYGRELRYMRIGETGIVRFIHTPTAGLPGWANLGPFVTPISSLQPGTLVYVKQQLHTAVVTWQNVNTSIQLVLRPDGAVDFIYDRPGSAAFTGQRGIFPGGHIASRKEFGTSLAAQPPSRVLIEDFELRSRLAVQESVIRSVYCILGSALFILVFFPLFFRVSLVEPLDALLRGVDQVDQGQREVQLPVRFNDEIGRLTSNFNQMTRSLKAAEDQVKGYTESLQLKVEERTSELARKNEENERLLLNILPASIAERLKRGEALIADNCAETTIVFADIVGFTALSAHIPATELVHLLSTLISDFDDLAQQHGVEKIKTIGDAYMAVAGLPQPRPDHADAAVKLALDMLRAAEKRKTSTGRSLQLRIGINSGSVIAGVIGTHKFAYDLWGDAVNTASRMESQGEPGRIQVTEATYKLLHEQYEFESRGQLEVKGKGLMQAYLLVTPRSCLAFA